jgi:phosphoserine aminotransferase
VNPRIYNFNPGPAVLPLPVLEQVQAEFLDFHDSGMSILESSHRGAEYKEIHANTVALFHEVFGLPDDFHVLFLGGGASTQFFHVPYNLLGPGKKAAFLNTGTWTKKAIKEAGRFGEVVLAASTEEENFTRLPRKDEIKIDPDAVYVHLVSNNTVFGTQWKAFPDTQGIPVVADMSSDILSRRLDFAPFGLIFAGAQKNLGPAGLTVVMVRQSLLEKCNPNVPSMVSYRTHVDKDSAFNTPPVFAVYVTGLVLSWVKEAGGLQAIEKINDRKAEMVYGAMDANPEFYKGTVTDKASRSKMNITFRLPDEEKEKAFVAEAAKKGFHGLKGHRSVGGIRVSTYNAMPVEGIEKLAQFMDDFARA